MAWHQAQGALLRNVSEADAVGNVLARVPSLTDEDLAALAEHWTLREASEARNRALGPDVPGVVAALVALDDVGRVFQVDLAGENSHCVLSVEQVRAGVHAVRDAVAASVARPSLRRFHYDLLMKPWERVFGGAPVLTPGVSEDAVVLAQAGGMAAGRCHDSSATELHDRLVAAWFGLGEHGREQARQDTRDAAMRAGLLRRWQAARVPVASLLDRLVRECPECRIQDPETLGDLQRALLTAADAASALVVEELAGESARVLVDPLRFLIPGQRRPN